MTSVEARVPGLFITSMLRDDPGAREDTMRLTVADAISPSYFVAIAAIRLGFFQQEGVDMEFLFSPPNPSQALKDGTIDFFGGSPYTGLRTFPGWRGGVLLCALSQYTYWFLAIRSDIKCEQGDVRAVKGLRLSASADPGLTVKRLLEEAGIDLQRDNVRIVPSPRRTSPYAYEQATRHRRSPASTPALARP